MLPYAADKTRLCAMIIAVSLLSMGGCQGSAGGGTSNINNSHTPGAMSSGASDNREELDLGADLASIAGQPRRTGGDSGRDVRSARSATTAPPSQPFWSCVLLTYDHDQHRQAAENSLAEIRRLLPQLSSHTSVHTTRRGSMVVYGRYDSKDDPQARADLQELRSMTLNGRRVFNRVLLAHLEPEVDPSQLHPHDLRIVRQQYPNTNTLYTLDVASWVDPRQVEGAGGAPRIDVQKEAEAYAAKLRARGFEAYFYHDPARGISTVTVGLFDHRAIDPQSGFESIDVKDLREHFPIRLLNGETVDIPINAKQPHLGSKPQEPMLVEVPQ